MKRILLWTAVLVAVVFLVRVEPSGRNISRLLPAQVLVVSEQEGICMQTDTGDMGIGDSVPTALENMRENATGEVFLDTVDYLLISKAVILEEIMPYLRPSCRVCLYKGEPDMEKLRDYLKHHNPGISLKDCNAGKVDLPTLWMEEGRIRIAVR